MIAEGVVDSVSADVHAVSLASTYTGSDRDGHSADGRFVLGLALGLGLGIGSQLGLGLGRVSLSSSNQNN
jgi:hypothetical protein